MLAGTTASAPFSPINCSWVIIIKYYTRYFYLSFLATLFRFRWDDYFWVLIFARAWQHTERFMLRFSKPAILRAFSAVDFCVDFWLWGRLIFSRFYLGATDFGEVTWFAAEYEDVSPPCFYFYLLHDERFDWYMVRCRHCHCCWAWFGLWECKEWVKRGFTAWALQP